METGSIFPRLMKIKAAARYLSMSPWKLRALVQNRQIHAVITGEGTSPWLFDRLELDQWIEKAKQTF